MCRRHVIQPDKTYMFVLQSVIQPDKKCMFVFGHFFRVDVMLFCSGNVWCATRVQHAGRPCATRCRSIVIPTVLSG